MEHLKEIERIKMIKNKKYKRDNKNKKYYINNNFKRRKKIVFKNKLTSKFKSKNLNGTFKRNRKN